jgi:hypothetical protein
MEYCNHRARIIEAQHAVSLNISGLPGLQLPCEILNIFPPMEVPVPPVEAPVPPVEAPVPPLKTPQLPQTPLLDNSNKRRRCEPENRCAAHLKSGPDKGSRCTYHIRIGEGDLCGYHCRLSKHVRSSYVIGHVIEPEKPTCPYKPEPYIPFEWNQKITLPGLFK